MALLELEILELKLELWQIGNWSYGKSNFWNWRLSFYLNSTYYIYIYIYCWTIVCCVNWYLLILSSIGSFLLKYTCTLFIYFINLPTALWDNLFSYEFIYPLTDVIYQLLCSFKEKVEFLEKVKNNLWALSLLLCNCGKTSDKNVPWKAWLFKCFLILIWHVTT